MIAHIIGTVGEVLAVHEIDVTSGDWVNDKEAVFDVIAKGQPDYVELRGALGVWLTAKLCLPPVVPGDTILFRPGDLRITRRPR